MNEGLSILVIVNYDRLRTAAINNPIHPTIKLTPPNGVIGPKKVTPSSPNNSRTLSKYNEPEKRKIPTANAMKDTRIEAFFALENVERNNKANV